MEKIAIIGNGCASVACFKAMRSCGYDGELHVFAKDGGAVYNPMLTTYYASSRIGWEIMFPYGCGNEIYDRYGVTLHEHSAVTALSVKNRSLTTEAGEFDFTKCLIATGASPLVPPFPGSDLPQVYVMRTAADAVKLRGAMEKKPRRALVVGASMVGVKLVEMFRQMGLEVTLADMAPHIFPLAAHAETAHRIESRLEGMGVALRFDAAIDRAEAATGGIRAWFKGIAEPVEADILLMCIGVRANIGFVNGDEIPVDKGVLVDARMEAGAPGIYAAGDAAQGRNIQTGRNEIIGLLANARRQGTAAGRNMAGVPCELPGEVLHNITHFMGIDFIGIGNVRDYDRAEAREDSGCFRQIFYKNGAVVGANFIDLYENSGVFKTAFVRDLIRGRTAGNPRITPVQAYLLKSM